MPNSNLAFGLSSDPGAVPLLVGVIGHRDPQPSAIQHIVNRFDFLLQQIFEACPSTPIWMLNGLADGMDMIAAETFLRRVRQARDVNNKVEEGATWDKLVAVLPKNRAEYLQDIHCNDDLQRVRQLLKASNYIVEPANNHELRCNFNKIPSEPECYAIQGAFIAKYSYLLFAFFDGVGNRLIGGTGHTLAIHQGDIHPLFRSVDEILDSREHGESIVIATPRMSTQAREITIQLNSINADFSDRAMATIQSLELINRELYHLSLASRLHCSIEGVFPRLCSYSDRVATFHKKRYQKIAALLVFVGFILVATADLYDKAAALGWGLVLAAFGIFPTIQKMLRRPFLTYRCLAESLVIQYIWSANNIKANVADLLSSYGNHDLDNIRMILRCVAFQLMLGGHCMGVDDSASLAKSRLWIKGQIEFLERRIQVFNLLSKCWKRVAYLFAGAAIFTAALRLFPFGIEPPEVVVNVFLAGFASSLAYQELMGYEQTCERYEISLRKFERANQALHYLDETSSQCLEDLDILYGRYRLVLDAIGREKIEELNEWMSKQLARSYQPS